MASASPNSISPGMEALTKDIISGFNILSLAGFVVMGVTLALSRSG
jgi:hypothetical protein